MGFKYTEPKVVKTEVVGENERTIYEANFLIPMQMFIDLKTGLSKEEKEAIEPLRASSIKQSFQQTGKTLSEYMKGYNDFKETQK